MSGGEPTSQESDPIPVGGLIRVPDVDVLSRFGASAFGVPAFGVPALGVPSFRVPALGVPAFGVPPFGRTVIQPRGREYPAQALTGGRTDGT